MGVLMWFKNFINNLSANKKMKRLDGGNHEPRDGRKALKNSVKASPINLLAPEVCREKNLILNIFKALGGNEKLLEHPILKKRLECIFENIMMQNGLGDYNINPNEEEIEAMVNAIRLSTILPREQIQDNLNGNEGNNYCGIEINPTTRQIKIQSLTCDGRLIEERYAINKLGKFQLLEDCYIRGKRSQLCLKEYNSQGIEVKRDKLKFEQDKKGKHRLVERVKVERNCLYPFVADYTIEVSEGKKIEKPMTSHKLLELGDLPRLENYVKTEDGDGNLRDVEFADTPNIDKYYMNDRKRIDEMLRAWGIKGQEDVIVE